MLVSDFKFHHQFENDDFFKADFIGFCFYLIEIM